MKRLRLLCRSVVLSIASLFVISQVVAGTNDLFNVKPTLKLRVNGKTVTLRGGALINLALGQPLDTALPPDLTLGAQWNCDTLQMDLVLCQISTLETVMPLASFVVVNGQANNKVAKVECVEGAYDFAQTNVLMGDIAHMVAKLDAGGCAAKTSLTITGNFAFATVDGALPIQVLKSKIKTYGPQVRPSWMTGAGSYGVNYSSGSLNEIALISTNSLISGSLSNSGVLILTNAADSSGSVIITNGDGGSIGDGGVIIIGGGATNTGSVITGTNSIISSGGACGSLIVISGSNTFSLGSGGALTLSTNFLGDAMFTALTNTVSQPETP